MALASSGGAGARHASARSIACRRSIAWASLGWVERGSVEVNARVILPRQFLHERRRTMTFASVQELIEGTRQVIDFNGGVRVKDLAALRGGTIDRLVHTAVFGESDVQAAARWLIWEAGWAVGIQSASIDSLYQARARNEYEKRTVPAMNVRAMAYDFARAIVASAKRRDVGAFIFELARSE